MALSVVSHGNHTDGYNTVDEIPIDKEIIQNVRSFVRHRSGGCADEMNERMNRLIA